MLCAHSAMNLWRILRLATPSVFAPIWSFSTFANVIINEIHYDPAVKVELVEFIELHNSGTTALDLSGWRLTEGVEFTFPAGTTIGAGGYLVVAENPARLQTKFGATALGPWIGVLANDGETIT